MSHCGKPQCDSFYLIIVNMLLTVDILVLGICHVVGVAVVHRTLHVELVLLVVRKHVVIVLEHVTLLVLVPPDTRVVNFIMKE